MWICFHYKCASLRELISPPAAPSTCVCKLNALVMSGLALKTMIYSYYHHAGEKTDRQTTPPSQDKLTIRLSPKQPLSLEAQRMDEYGSAGSIWTRGARDLRQIGGVQ